MIEIKNLTKVYEDGTKAIDNVSLKADKNKITGLIGFNGSGKTTTFNILVDFIENYKGNILFDGKKADLNILRTISYLAAGSEPKNKTKIKDHLHTIASMYGANRKWADKQIEKYSSLLELEKSLNTKIGSLSKGNQQKVKIIASLLNPNVKYMFLDEPFDGLDPIMVRRIQKELIALSKNVTMLITSHRMEVVQEMCEEFYLLKNGILVEAKKTTDKEVIVRVNKEVAITKIKKLKEVKSVNKYDNYYEIIVQEMKDVKKVQKELIKSTKYIYSSYIEKNIADAVFNKYREDE